MAGCGTPGEIPSALLTNLLCFGSDLDTDLTRIPDDLQYVLDNEEDFNVANHSLKGTTPGTVIDDVAGSVDGCWGFIGDEPESGHASRQMSVAVVYRVDLERGLLQMQELDAYDDGLALWDGLPALFITDHTITELSADTLTLERIYGDGALVQDNGTLRSDCLTAVAATISTVAPIRLTIDGDSMVTLEDFSVERLRYWKRFPCVAEEMELIQASESEQ
jgi:hypothetical protein